MSSSRRTRPTPAERDAVHAERRARDEARHARRAQSVNRFFDRSWLVTGILIGVAVLFCLISVISSAATWTLCPAVALVSLIYSVLKRAWRTLPMAVLIFLMPVLFVLVFGSAERAFG